jgi:hypothetical protein
MRDYRPSYKQDSPPMWAQVVFALAALAAFYIWLVVILSLG